MTRILYFVCFFVFAGCVKDADFNPDLAIDQRALTLNAVSDTAKMMVYASGNWTIENRDNASWITLQQGSGNGDAYAIVSVSDNSAGLPRAGTLVVKAGSVSDTIRLGQRGIVPKILITALSVSSPAAGGKIQTAIDANLPLNTMNVNYTYGTGNDWISGLQIANNNLVFDVAANTSAATRKAVIYLSFLDAIGTNTRDSLTVNQAKP